MAHCFEKYLKLHLTLVSPAYGFSALALVKCSNEGGPGRAQTQHEGGSRDLYPDHEERAWMPSVPYTLVLRIR